MKIEISKKDIVWSYVGYFFSLFTNVLLLPFVMSFVPSDELGLWYTFLSLGSFVTILDNTFAGNIYRNITYAFSGAKEIRAKGYSEIDGNDKKTDLRLLISIIKTCQRIYQMVSLLALVLLLSLGSLYLSVSADIFANNIWLVAWVIYTMAIFFNLLYSYWLTSLRGVGAMQQSQKANVLAKITQIAVSLIGLFLGGGVIAMAIGYLASGVVMRIYGKHQLMKYSNIGTVYNRYISLISKAEVKENYYKIWYNAKKTGLVCFGTFGITQTTTLVCSAWLGLEETASYGLSLQIITALAGVARIYFEAVKPRLIGLRVSDSRKLSMFKRETSLAICVYWGIFLIEMIVLAILGLPLIGSIKSDTQLPIAMILFMGTYLFLENNHSVFCAVIEMSNVVPYVKSSLISAVCVVVGEILVVTTLDAGIYGLMSIQFIVQLCYNNWHWPRVAMREMGVTLIDIVRLGSLEGQERLGDVIKKRKT